jgi:hypothetical protein
LIGFVFWISSLHDRPDFKERSNARARERSSEVSPELAVDMPAARTQTS